MVRFATNNAEIVPAFDFRTGRYWICDTHNGGCYKETDPVAETQFIQAIHAANNNNLRPLIKMLKAWQSYCSVPIKSFHLELLSADFLPRCQWRLQSYFYFDWILRDFFEYLCNRANGIVCVPGTLETIPLGDAWKSRALSAYNRALKACLYERNDWIHAAGQEWQKIFGPQIPVRV